jgi:hypothetical protein
MCDNERGSKTRIKNNIGGNRLMLNTPKINCKGSYNQPKKYSFKR